MALCNHALENLAQDLALTEAAKPIHRERRMVRNLIVEIELAEPAVGKMQRSLQLLVQIGKNGSREHIDPSQ